MDNRHIVPGNIQDGILINLPQRMLFLLDTGTPNLALPVAVGKPDWPTPRGDFTVAEKRKNPVWRVPASIQDEMEDEQQGNQDHDPAGAQKPFGQVLHRTELVRDRHSWNDSAAQYPSSAHARLYPAASGRRGGAFRQGQRRHSGEIVDAPVLLAQLDDGRIFVEANPDIYNLESDPVGDLEALADSRNLRKMVDWRQVRETGTQGRLGP